MPPAALPSRASVVVIGGGVVGLSTAYHLARAGVRDVVLLEKDELGCGSTCKAAGGVRAQFSDAVNVELGARSLRTFETFAESFGQDIDLHQVGYLFLLDDEEHVAAFEANVALQNDLGVPSRMIDVAEARALSPMIDPTGLLAAAYSPTDGHCTPESVVAGYARAPAPPAPASYDDARRVEVLSEGGVITGVRTEHGVIATDTVVCAAGAWSRDLGLSVGVDLPVTPLRRQILVTEPVPGVDPRTPFTIDFARLLLPPRGPGPAPRHVRPGRDPRLQAGPRRGVAAGSRRGHRAPGAVAGRRRDRLRLGRALRDDAGPQRSRRRGRGRLALPLRHRVLRSRLPHGACPRGGRARPLPWPDARRRRLRAQRHRFSDAADPTALRPELNIV